MEERVANNLDKLIQIWKNDWKYIEDDFDDEEFPISGHVLEHDFTNIIIDFKLDISSLFLKKLTEELSDNIPVLKFKNCKFLHKICIYNLDIALEFTNNCLFKKQLSSFRYLNNLTFRDCSIENINFENGTFGEIGNLEKKGKIRFHKCNFKETNFNTTTFNQLIDFWNSTFHKPSIFYRTDFNATADFSAVTFKKNVLFTYSLIASKAIFRGTEFKNGLDLSLAIISGDLNLFDFPYLFFEHSNPKSEDDYKTNVSVSSEIPLKNKKETFRIIKRFHQKASNNIEALDYKALERGAEGVELGITFKRKRKQGEHFIEFIFNKIKSIADAVLLFFNFISNGHGRYYFFGFVFILIWGGLFFSLSLIGTSEYEFSFNIDKEIIEHNIPNFLNFLNPTHKFNYLGDDFPKESLQNWFYVWDFWGRIFVGYGLYQTVSAFRKYK